MRQSQARRPGGLQALTDVLHYAFTTKGGSGLVAAPHQGHLDTLIDEFEFQLSENPDLMSAIAVNKSGHPAITRKPYFNASSPYIFCKSLINR